MRNAIVPVLLIVGLLAMPTAMAVTVEDCEGRQSGDAGFNSEDPCARTAQGVDKVVNAIQIIAGPLLGLVVLGAGLAWGMSGGNERVRAQARTALIAALAGLVLVLLADPIVDFVRSAF